METYTIKIKQGEDFKIRLLIRDESLNPIDLTGHVFSGQIRKTASGDDIQASFTFNLLDQIVDTGKVEVLLSSASSSAIDVLPSPRAERTITFMAYDIESVFNGVTKRWLQGVAEISPEVTR